MSEQENNRKRTYFRPTTAQQRRLLFETYEQSHNVDEACRVAHVARRTFYYWLSRFRAGGYAALVETRSRAPHKTRIPPTPQAIIDEVVAYRLAQPQAGYRRIANELKKAHDWQAVISPTQVRRILLPRGLVRGAAPQPAAAVPAVPAVHAPEPEQTANLDLCLVPLTHASGAALLPVTVNAVVDGVFSPSAAGEPERA